MPETGNQVLRRYLEELITVEKMMEAQLTDFASAETDDPDLQNLLSAHADETRTQQAKLSRELERIGGSAGALKSPLSALFQSGPHLPRVVHATEERSLRNIIATYAAETTEIACYEALANVARAAGDPDVEAAALEIQSQERIMAEKVWHLLPSRSKIAFNMLTVSEVDPAVETKMADDRVGS